MPQCLVSTTDCRFIPIYIKLQYLTYLLFPTSHRSKLKGGRIKSTITNRGQQIRVVLSLLGQSQITSIGIDTMAKHLHAADSLFTALGLDLKKRVALQVKFYKSMPQNAMRAISIQGQSDSMPSMDNFLRSFIRLYQKGV